MGNTINANIQTELLYKSSV